MLNLHAVSELEVTKLNKFVDKVNVHVRSLNALGVTENKYDIFLTEIILSRVPNPVKLRYSKLKKDSQTMEGLMEILQTEIKGLELVKSTIPQHNTKLYDKPKSKMQNFCFPAVANSDRKCTICDVISHRTHRCPKLFACKDIAERIELVKSKNACFNCLGPHRVKQCKSAYRCSICNKSHNTLLHSENKISQYRNSDNRNVQNQTEEDKTVCNIALKEITYLPIINIDLCATEATSKIGFLLDSGSQFSFILESSVNSIKHRFLRYKQMSVTGFNGIKISGKYEVVECYMKTSENILPISFVKVRELCNGIFGDPTRKQFTLSNGYTLNYHNKHFEAIIGNDNYFKIATGEVEKLSQNLAAVNTIGGWTLQGSVSSEETCCNFVVPNYSKEPENLDLTKYWEIENPTNSVSNPYNTTFYKQFESTIQRNSDGRYSVSFPWKSERIMWNTYESYALSRLFQALKKLLSLGLLKEYDKILKGYITNDFSEKENNIETTNRCRILPHHPVVKLDRTSTKVRIVLDGSARSNMDDLSLNDCMYEGSNFLPNLIGVLTRFRMNKVAMTADIEKAFLQIELNESNRDAVRYYWFEEDLSDNWPKMSPQLYRMKRVPFGAKASPFLLCATIKYHIKNYLDIYPKTVKLIENNLYMDDFIISVDSYDEAKQIKEEAIQIFADMKMNLTKWHSSEEVNNDNGEVVKILGVRWNLREDTLITPKIAVTSKIRTKRNLASFVCGFWDPLGLFSPCLVKFKLLMQETWKQKLEWDNELPQNVQNELSRLLESVTEVESMEIPRCICRFEGRIQYHMYCDASNRVYGACVYARIFDSDNNLIESNLLLCKNRLASLKHITIPRLELLGALLGSRLVKFIKEQCDISHNILAFCDSKVVLSWIYNVEKRWKDFVQNRVDEIREIIDPSLWKYVPTESNPADIITRGMSVKDLKSCELWWKGPLQMSNQSIEIGIVTDEEKKVSTSNVSIQYEPLVDINKFSNWFQLVRTIAYVIKFTQLTLKRESSKSLSVHHIRLAENLLIKSVQMDHFGMEIKCLKSDQDIPKSSKLYSLNPFLDDSNLLRVNTRLDNSHLTYNEKFPIIIPFNSHLDTLVVRSYHIGYLHSGINTTMSKIRRKYWIIRCRSKVKHVLHYCKECQRYRSKPVQERWAPLPLERIDTNQFRAFLYSGVDYFGPIPSTVGKCYVAIFTCLRVRGIHMELTTSLRSNEFLAAFERFISRRGIPRILYSDNGKTFKGSEAEVCSKYDVEWKYTVEMSPHKGGVWERLIRSVKFPLRIALRHTILDPPQLQTLLCQIESIVNQRPLTYTTSGPEDITSITPEDYLLPTIINNEGCGNNENLRLIKILNEKKHIAMLFFKRWKEEYLKQKVISGASNKAQE